MNYPTLLVNHWYNLVNKFYQIVILTIVVCTKITINGLNPL
jgi:hypothetical protein